MERKLITISLIFLLLSISCVFAEDTNATGETLTLNVNNQQIDIYSYKIDNESYLMLRDIAYILNTTNKQINITWDNEKKAIKILKNTEYVNIGSELKIIDNNAQIKINPFQSNLYYEDEKLDITAYVINGNSYLRLQDMMLILDICLVYDEHKNLVGIDTTLPYDKENHIFYSCKNVTILLYHNLIENEPSKDQYYISVSKDKFENDVKSLLDEGFHPLSLENYYLNKYDKNKKYFILAFDDGYLSNYKIAYPIIKKYNVYADIFINTDNIYMDHHFKLEQAKEMEDSGLVKIYSHYPTHIDLRNVEPNEYTTMLKKSIETLEIVLNKKDFYFFAYPYGYYNEEKYNLTKEAGFKLQAIQTVTYEEKDLIKRYGVTHKTNVIELINSISR